MFTSIRFYYCLLICALLSIGANIVQAQPQFYNNNTGTSSNSFPLNSATSNRVQWIYGPGTLNSAGSSGTPSYYGYITTIYFRTSTSSTITYSNFTISLGQSMGTATTFPSTAFVSGLTQSFYLSSHQIALQVLDGCP